MKRLIALAACAALLLGLLAGCGSAGKESGTASGAVKVDNEPIVAAEDAETVLIGLGGTGFATYAPDEITGVINGTEANWTEYYYWLSYFASYYLQSGVSQGLTLSSWDAVGELSSQYSNGEAIARVAQYSIVQNHALETEAAKMGVTLGDEDYEMLESIFEEAADADGDGVTTEEEIAAFEDSLASQGLDKDFYLYHYELLILSDLVFKELYGANAEKCSDSVTEQYIAEKGYMSAKRIAILNVDPATGAAIDEAAAEEKRELAYTLEEELAAAAASGDTDALIALFDEYMWEYSEDTNLPDNPDGYLVTEDGSLFTETVASLDENYGLSGVVETDYGYELILRQPVLPDTVVSTNSSGEAFTARYEAAEEQFTVMVSVWTDTADVTWYEGFELPDMQAIFG